jgi:hypothetical protein
MGQPLTKQNASEAGHSCVVNCGPPGRRYSNSSGAVNVFDAKLDVDGRPGYLCDLSPAGDYHVAGRNVCLPSYSASTKVAGSIDHDHVFPAFDSVIFRRLIVVRAAEGNATTADDPSQQHLRLPVDTIRRTAFESRKPLECGGPTPLF